MKNTLPQYCADNTLLIPESLFGMADARPVMAHEGAAIFHKRIVTDMKDVEFYTNAPCLAFVMNGEESFTAFDHTRIKLLPGELLFMSRNLYMLSDFVSAEGPLEAFLFFFDTATIEAFLRRGVLTSEAREADHRPYKIAANVHVSRYMAALKAVYRDFKGTPDLLRAKLLELLLMIEALDDGPRLRAFLQGAKTAAAKRNIRHVMRENCLHNLSVKDFAALTGRSAASFSRDFKRQFGMTPGRWLIEARLEKARQLLLDTGLSVTEIALEVGYENSSHFIKAFKDKYGQTPKKARARILC